MQATARSTRGSSVVRFQVAVARPRHPRPRSASAVKAIVIKVAKLAGDKAVSLLLPRLAEGVEKAVWKQRGLAKAG